MIKRFLAAGTSALFLLSSLSACGQVGWKDKNEVPPYPVTVENVTIEKKPRAVASLSPSITRLLLDLGYQDRIVGYSDNDEIPEDVELSDLTELIADAEAAAKETASSLVPAPEDTSSASNADAVASESSTAAADPASVGESSAMASQTPSDLLDVSSDSSTSSTPLLSSGESSSGEVSSSEITISVPEDWDGKTPLPKEPVYIGTLGTALEPDMIRIGILKPEIMFTTLPLTKAQMDQLDGVNIRVVLLPEVNTLAELEQRIPEIVTIMEGQLSEKAESGSVAVPNGTALVEEMKAKLDYIISQLPAQKESFLYLVGEDMLPATGDTLESDVLSLLGENLAADGTNYTLTAETLAGLEPDVILYSTPLERANIEQNEAFAQKSAATAGALVKIDQSALRVQTRAIVETVRELAAQLYPDIDFTEPVSSDESGVSGESEAGSGTSSAASEPTEESDTISTADSK